LIANARNIAKTKGAATASYMMRDAGFPADFVNNIVLSNRSIEDMLKEQEKIQQVTQKDVDAAAARQESFSSLTQSVSELGRTILRDVTPAITKLLVKMTEWLKVNGPWLEGQLTKKIDDFTTWISTGINWESIGKNLHEFVDNANAAAKAVGGWYNMTWLLFALWTGGQIAKVMANIAMIYMALTGGITVGGGLIGAILAMAAAAALLNKLVPKGEPPGYPTNPVAPGGNPARPNYYRHGRSVHQQEVDKEAATAPWNRQTGGPPAALTKPHGDKMPPFEDFQKAIKESQAPSSAAPLSGSGFQGGSPWNRQTTGEPVTAVGGAPPAAFIAHWTGNTRDTLQSVQATLKGRHLGVQYFMDRQGKITKIGGPGEHQIRRGSGQGAGLSNANTVGMEVAGTEQYKHGPGNYTKEQVESYVKFMRENYPNTPVFGHGEVNPGHKEPQEGLMLARIIHRRLADVAQAADLA
jgi:hypothetical protein